MASFYVFLRGDRSPYYQVKFLDDDGRIVATRSTGEKKRDRALMAAAEMARSGILPTAEKGTVPKATTLSDTQTFDQLSRTLRVSDLSPDQAQRLVTILAKRGLLTKSEGARVIFADWLEEFWSWENSAYVKERLALGHRITKSYVVTNARHVTNHYRPFFDDKLLGEIARADLKAFFLYATGLGLSASSVNSLMNVSKVALGWAYHNELITMNPAEGMPQARTGSASRGILTEEELESLQGVEWDNLHAACGFLVALTCGLRAGEILGLRVEDIGPESLSVRRQWSNPERAFRDTKNKESRTVPLLAQTRAALLELAASNPYGDGLVFWAPRGEGGTPADQKVLVEGFYAALRRIGVSEQDREHRKLVFHGLRHLYATKMVDRVDVRKVSLATGHKSSKMTQHYAEHQTAAHLEEVRRAASDAFDVKKPRVRSRPTDRGLPLDQASGQSEATGETLSRR